MVRRGGAHLPDQTLLLAAGDNVGASPPNSALLQDLPTIDVENLWGLDATSYGNHEFDFGSNASSSITSAPTSRSSANIVDEDAGESRLVGVLDVVTSRECKVGLIGATVRTTRSS